MYVPWTLLSRDAVEIDLQKRVRVRQEFSQGEISVNEDAED
jgi:hypothetical protein